MVIVWEQRTQGAVHQTSCQNFIIGSFSLSLRKTAGETAKCGEFLLVFNLQRHEINSGICLFRSTNSSEQNGIAHTDGNGAVRLLCQFPGFDGDGSAISQIDRLVNWIKHNLLSNFSSIFQKLSQR